MNWWGAVVALLFFGAVVGVIALIVMAVTAAVHAYHRAIWRRAYLLAHDQPDVVAQVVEELDLVTAVPPAVAVDEMSHSELVERVLADEQERLELEAELEQTVTGMSAQIAAGRARIRQEQAERDRQERAKRRHWATVQRLRNETEEGTR